MGRDESHFNVSLIVRTKSQDSVHRPQLPWYSLITEEKGQPKRIRTDVLLLTSLTLYRWAKPSRFVDYYPDPRSLTRRLGLAKSSNDATPHLKDPLSKRSCAERSKRSVTADLSDWSDRARNPRMHYRPWLASGYHYRRIRYVIMHRHARYAVRPEKGMQHLCCCCCWW